MIRRRDIPPRSFAKTRYFPGTAGNPFDVILQSASFFDRIPDFIVFFLLVFLALLGGKFCLYPSVFLFIFFMLDMLWLDLLHRLGLSYGPIKPVLLMLAVLRTPFALLPYWWAYSFEFLGTLLIIYGFLIEPFRVDVHHEQLSSEKIAKSDKITIAHLGDLHIERITSREKQILKELEAVKPDLILFSGDVLNLSYVEDEYAQQQAREFLSSLHAPLGVYAVTGSPPVDLPEAFADLVAGTEVQRLDNSKAVINLDNSILQITGLTCTHHPDEDFDRLQKLSLDTSTFNILLYHSPDIAPLACNADFDLQLSGHTHGGQVRLPFYGAIFAASLYGKAFESGRYLLQKMTLYVTRGLGMEGGIAPRVRFLCPPELIFWEITGE
jgi:predicted MPP superfamily phosphohydrolase